MFPLMVLSRSHDTVLSLAKKKCFDTIKKKVVSHLGVNFPATM